MLDEDRCEVECNEGGSLYTHNYMICKNTSIELEWVAVPNCTCPDPVLPKNLNTTEDCSKKKLRETCNLTCSDKKSSLFGNIFIRYQNNTKWSPPPKCF
ncbi:sushi, von Willebrand factor type A, EGF and pentraxin domain-containing protein 1 [Nephila pilipes]|uniref:Sushi, von Willebrand factor type A, EGF and pentraxin domain-containing protein 1 n=1 Tax=Nephila pilipes TaxID=299642 RepID=A0A8X6PGF5_NEPPI|nr:sushi, von Willebrand factor type A, EGF and pentraxin domain-containing protein 1 [Nephila pilipes]